MKTKMLKVPRGGWQPKEILSEEYVVKFQYEVNGITHYDGRWKYRHHLKGKHKEAGEEFLKQFSNKYNNLQVNGVDYQ